MQAKHLDIPHKYYPGNRFFALQNRKKRIDFLSSLLAAITNYCLCDFFEEIASLFSLMHLHNFFFKKNGYINTMKLLRGYLANFISLLFPELCPACGTELVAHEQIICTDCVYNLPLTNFHLQPDNVVARQFWGKINIAGAYSLYYFSKGGKVQSLMHHLKYKGMHQIGDLLGNMAGAQLISNSSFTGIDYIIPVPLHKNRLKERGYNQSACFARGLAQKIPANVEEHNLVRIRHTDTQTHKSRFARFENMREVFTISNPHRLINKHVLLVDDTVTTGSTLEACGTELLKIPGLKLSIATIAYAE